MELKEKDDNKLLIRINELVLNEETYIEEFGILETAFLIFMAAFYGYIGFEKIKRYFDKKMEDKIYYYEVSGKPIKNIPKNLYNKSKVKDAILAYAYISLGIRTSQKGTLLYSSSNKSNLNKKVYLYKYNKDNLVLIKEGTFSDICDKYNINVKPFDESLLKDRKSTYKLAVDIIKKEISKYPDLKRHAHIGENDKDIYNEYINGINDSVAILQCDVWDVVPNARSDEGRDIAQKKIWNPSDEITSIINNKLPKGYKVNHDGDWDDLLLMLHHNVNIKESSIEEETRIEPDKLPKHIYHISSVNHNGEVFEPRKYDNENVKNDMERYVSRVCFADSIQGCLYSIFPNGAYDADFYVHIPGHDVKVYATTKDDIYDSEITHELWVKEPVEMKCIGKIHVSGVSNKGTKTIDIESDKVPYNKKKYHKCIWRWVDKYDKDEALYEFCN